MDGSMKRRTLLKVIVLGDSGYVILVILSDSVLLFLAIVGFSFCF